MARERERDDEKDEGVLVGHPVPPPPVFHLVHLFFHRHLKSRPAFAFAAARDETFRKSQKRGAMAKFPRFTEI